MRSLASIVCAAALTALGLGQDSQDPGAEGRIGFRFVLTGENDGRPDRPCASLGAVPLGNRTRDYPEHRGPRRSRGAWTAPGS